MRVVRGEAQALRVPLTVPYRIAGRSFDAAEILVVALHDESGLTGHGTGSPVPPLTGDDFSSALGALERRLLPAVVGQAGDLEALLARAEAASPATRSALAALDIALHDLRARQLGVPLHRMLGGERPGRRLVTSVTVGIDSVDRMVEAARRHVERGFRILKIKIGEDPALDVERLRAIQAAVGERILLRVDANEGYSVAQAVAIVSELDRLGVELFEQPVAAGDLEGLRRAGRAGRLPVVADEPVRIAADLAPLVAAGAARGVNIKLMKCGGIREARRIDEALGAAGWLALVGCMDESRAGIAAAAHFAMAAASVAWIDLDGHLDLASDPFTGGFEITGGEIRLLEAPGLGVAPARS